MVGGIYESPLAMRAFIKWRDEVDDGTMLLRDIIDLETTYARINGGANEPEVSNDNLKSDKSNQLNQTLKMHDIDVSNTSDDILEKNKEKDKINNNDDNDDVSEDDSVFDDEKVMQFFSDCKAPADQVDCLILHAICGAKDLMAIERDALVEGLSQCGCSDLKTIAQRVQEIKSKMTSNSGSKVIKLFAKYIFRMICEDARQRSLPIIATTDEETGEEVTPVALIVFKMMYVEGVRNVFPFGENFLQFLMENPMIGDDQVKAVTCDDWTMIAEFLLQSKTDDKFDDELSDWPLLIESYMSWNLRGKAKAMTS
jgi:hypothetical protein